MLPAHSALQYIDREHKRFTSTSRGRLLAIYKYARNFMRRCSALTKPPVQRFPRRCVVAYPWHQARVFPAATRGERCSSILCYSVRHSRSAFHTLSVVPVIGHSAALLTCLTRTSTSCDQSQFVHVHSVFSFVPLKKATGCPLNTKTTPHWALSVTELHSSREPLTVQSILQFAAFCQRIKAGHCWRQRVYSSW